MQLSLRLSAIAAMVTEGNRLVDVGCDHGYLPVYLLQNKKIPSAIAMDVRKGPLSRAQENIAQYALEEYIETRLSDGLDALMPGEGDTLVLAGMGGPLMERILQNGAELLETFREAIFQPQSDIPHFRRFICAQGWTVTAEDAVEEDGKFYFLMKAVKSDKNKMKAYTGEEELFGRLLLEKKNPVLRSYLKREAEICEKILDNLAAADTLSSEARRTEIKEEMQLIETAWKRYEDL